MGRDIQKMIVVYVADENYLGYVEKSAVLNDLRNGKKYVVVT